MTQYTTDVRQACSIFLYHMDSWWVSVGSQEVPEENDLRRDRSRPD